MMRPCREYHAYLALPAAPVALQSQVAHEWLRAHLIGRDDQTLAVWITGAKGRLRGLKALGVDVDTPTQGTGQPHLVRLAESPIEDDDHRPVATCVTCGKRGRHTSTMGPIVPRWGKLGIQVPRVTVPDPTHVQPADTDILWET